MSDQVEPGKIESERIHTGKIITLDRDTVRLPDGTTGAFDIVRHSGASAIVPFLSDPAGDDPQILLIKQYRYAAGGYLYEIPAGRLDDNEEPRHCAVRELKEETGCVAERIDHMCSILTTPGFSDEVIHLFVASGLERGEHHREADEFMTVETMSLSRALQMIRSGEIRDAKTTIGILYAAGFIAGH